MKLLLIVLIASVIAGCSSKDFVGSPKFESALNIKLKKMIKENDDSPIGIIMLTKEKLNSSERTELKNTGVKIGSETGNIITATGTPEAVIKAGELEIVTQIQLAKTNYLKK